MNIVFCIVLFLYVSIFGGDSGRAAAVASTSKRSRQRGWVPAASHQIQPSDRGISDYQLGYYGRSRRSDNIVGTDISSGRIWKKITVFLQESFCGKNIKSVFYSVIFGYFTADSVLSIWDDEWAAERDPQRYFAATSWRWHHERERDVVRRRVFKDRTIRKLVGAGYTPRLVFLFGIMLRGFVRCTALPKIFDPPIGWGAGSVVAARFACREWLPIILIGWYASKFYWNLFSVNGPPKDHSPDDPFYGFPITIHKVMF